jgi:hypothetical protein
MDDFVQSADEVIWLDLPARVTIPRILRRHMRLSIAGTNRHPGIRNLVRFAAGQPDYHRNQAREPTVANGLGRTQPVSDQGTPCQAVGRRHGPADTTRRSPMAAWRRHLTKAMSTSGND